MIKMTKKEKLLAIINKVVPINDYNDNDFVFSEKYFISPTDFIYILQALAKEYHFTINDDLVDSLENCTFATLEALMA